MMKKENDQYTEESFVTETGVHVTIRRPILTPEERKRREDRIRKALCKFYEECRKHGIPWKGDPGYEEYVADYNRRYPGNKLYNPQ